MKSVYTWILLIAFVFTLGMKVNDLITGNKNKYIEQALRKDLNKTTIKCEENEYVIDQLPVIFSIINSNLERIGEKVGAKTKELPQIKKND